MPKKQSYNTNEYRDKDNEEREDILTKKEAQEIIRLKKEALAASFFILFEYM